MALQQQTAFASAARTATPTAVEIDVADNVTNAEILVVTSAIGAAPSTTINLEEQDDTGAWSVILASAAIVAVGQVRMLLGPDIAAAANVAAQCVLPRKLRVRPVHGNANSHTYSIRFTAR